MNEMSFFRCLLACLLAYYISTYVAQSWFGPPVPCVPSHLRAHHRCLSTLFFACISSLQSREYLRAPSVLLPGDVCIYVCIYGWMDRWIDGWVDEWIDGCVYLDNQIRSARSSEYSPRYIFFLVPLFCNYILQGK